MRDNNQRNENGQRHGQWIFRWFNSNIFNTYNFINGRMFGYSAHYNVKEELITSSYYAR